VTENTLFGAPRDQRLYRLKPSFNGGSVPANPVTALHYAEWNFFHSLGIHQCGRFRPEKATIISPHSESILV
jgi:hypothetical protein